MEYAVAIANYFVEKSLDTGIELTPMKVVKLVYIAHGWHLALTNGSPLLGEGVQAWQYGPVVPSVYNNFKQYGSKQIDQLAYVINDGQPTYPTLGRSTIVAFLDKIWDMYKGYTGIELSALTHKVDTPWYKIWVESGGKNSLGAIIPNDLIEEHYKSKL